jgi:preprotein translocase subunit SecG
MASQQTEPGSVSSERLFQILSSEQQHIDKQIESMMDLQTKILAFLFPALAVAVGWILTASGKNDQASLSPAAQAGVLFGLNAVMCFGILLSVICYAMSAEYTRYKKEVLGSRFVAAIGAGHTNPLDSSGWGKSGMGIAIRFAVSALWFVITTVLVAVLVAATDLSINLRPPKPLLTPVMWLSYAISAVSILAALFSASRTTQRLAGKLFLGIENPVRRKS